jgi:hypothetical protein
VFTQDYLFKSPSAAAAIVVGNNMNRWLSWKNGVGKTLDAVGSSVSAGLIATGCLTSATFGRNPQGFANSSGGSQMAGLGVAVNDQGRRHMSSMADA